LDVSKRAYNFCAGPAALPEAVLQRAQGELLDWHGKGLSVMEMSHRSDEFVSIATKAEQDLRDLLDIPRTTKCCSCKVAPASSSRDSAEPAAGKRHCRLYRHRYLVAESHRRSARYGNVNVAATAKPYDYFAIPGQNEWKLSKDAAYVHYAPTKPSVAWSSTGCRSR
jgi:phosphoserine aminotransferase